VIPVLLACATCFDPNETSQALLQATIFLSLLPLAMLGGAGWYAWRRVLSHESHLPPHPDA
jgi:hypothetical protein